MKNLIGKLPFSLLGLSAIGLWGAFYSDFFGIWPIVSIIVILFLIVFAFMDFRRVAQVESLTAQDKKQGGSVRKYIDSAPFSLIVLSMLSFQEAMHFLAYENRFGLWCVIPAIVDLVLIVLAFRKFYIVSVGKDSNM